MIIHTLFTIAISDTLLIHLQFEYKFRLPMEFYRKSIIIAQLNKTIIGYRIFIIQIINKINHNILIYSIFKSS